ncbi:MAG: 3-phosphoserine/phosphohydroxythreonine transaminase [Eubacteriales bacterium]|nr:3-phosphoserine/phosphohydroxythreonine transaminase [Eubacteriales bacterium]
MNTANRIFNFSAGPSMLPLPVLEQAKREMVNYQGCGMSVMEMSHRSKEFKAIIEKAEQDLRDLMDIPDSYKVLFLQGGGSLQFSMIPLNLFHKSKKADFIITGSWAKKAAQEAAKFGEVNILASSEEDTFTYIPQVEPEKFSKDADYCYITYNNTIYGTRYTKIPDTGDVPLVSDLSSMILSEELDLTKFGLVFAGAQKNIGPAGVTIVIIREDLIGLASQEIPTMLNYQIHAKHGSLYNTPPCYAIYMAGLTFQWIKEQGGVSAMQKINEEKAALLYGAIDNSSLFHCPVAEKDRSLMNVVFVTGDEVLDKKFIAQAKAEGLMNLGGHRTVGGMRASIYNAMPMKGVQTLVNFMIKFERENI